MLNNYLKIASRRLRKEKLFTVINVTGLTVGIAAFILLSVYVRHELSYDKFHSKVDNIHVIGFKANGRDGKARWESFSIKGAGLMRDRIPEMKMMTQVSTLRTTNLVRIGESDFYETGVIQTDENFFKIFDFEVLQGTPQLGKPAKAAITSSVANKYFNNKNPIGELIEIEGFGDFEVTALLSDPPVNSHIQFKIIVSNYDDIHGKMAAMPEGRAWSMSAGNYMLLTDDADLGAIESKVNALSGTDFPEHMLDKDEEGKVHGRSYLLPFGDIHLRSGFTWALSPVGDIVYVYIFSSIAILILFIACFNYINLVTARSIKKAKEIGLRKVIGAQRKQIILQQMVEASLFTFLSVSLAFALAERTLPYFNSLIGTQLKLNYLSMDFVVFVLGLSIVIAFIAGYYPAFKLSKFSPISGLRGTEKPKGKSGMRRGLVLFQFFITQTLIICTFIIQSQLSYIQNKSLGYDREQTLFIDTHGELKDRGQLFRSELETIPGVSSVSMSESKFDYNGIVFIPFNSIKGFENAEPKDIFVPSVFAVDSSFVKTMGMEIVAGKAFHELDNLSSNMILINETTAKKLGWESPLGKELTVWQVKRRVVGVVKDFHDESLKVDVKPAILTLEKNPSGFANIKIQTMDVEATLDAIEAEWNAMVPDRPLSFQFYNTFYDAQYKKEARLGNLFNAFSIIAISISILGLIGLTTFSAQQRLKEFGVRKVLGARVLQLVALLSKEFVWLLAIAFILAAPLTYHFMSNWLTEFTYRIDIGIVIYLLAALATLIICMLTVGLQAFKVARFNPAEVLRSE